MGNNPGVAAVLLNWNGLGDTVECIASLKELNGPAVSVVVVDNGSANGEAEKIEQLFPDIRLIRSRENIGFAAGNNLGIKWAAENGFEYIWILNNDTTVEKDSLSRQMSHFSRGDVGAVGAKIKIYGKDLIWSKGIDLFRFSLFPPGIRFFSNIDEGKKDDRGEGQRDRAYISGCSMLIRSGIKAKYFDERYFAYCEDMELCHRITAEGYRIVYEPGAVIHHKAAASSGGEKFNTVTAYWGYRNKLLFMKDACSPALRMLLIPAYLSCLLRDIFRIIFRYGRKKELFAAVLNGARDGARYFTGKGGK